MQKKKILAVASIGGHWIQLLRIAQPLESTYSVVYLSTHDKCRTMVETCQFYKISDFNRNNAWRMVLSFFRVLIILLTERPAAVLTTGAAPGLLTVFIARMLFIKTIWIDSVANVKQLSVCGRLACFFAHHVYTQWPDLVSKKVKFAGNIFGNQGEIKK